MTHKEQVAGICGIFCGTCPHFPIFCHGCLSDKKAPHCAGCPSGFQQCAREHGVARCYQCPQFPCTRLEGFLEKHCENGISHHSRIIENLQKMREMGVASWVDEQLREARCPRCGSIKRWNSPQYECCASNGPGIVTRIVEAQKNSEQNTD